MSKKDQERMNIHQRINAVMKEVTYAVKEQKKGMQYAVVSYDDVVGKARTSFVEHGVNLYPQNMVVNQNGNRTEMTLDVKFQSIDVNDDFILIPSAGYGIDNQDKGPGKAETYCMKSAILKTLLMQSGQGEDPDFDQNTEHTPEPPKHVYPDGWGISKIKTELRDFYSEMHSCEDADQLELYKESKKDFLVIVKNHYPEGLFGDDSDINGLAKDYQALLEKLQGDK